MRTFNISEFERFVRLERKIILPNPTGESSSPPNESPPDHFDYDHEEKVPWKRIPNVKEFNIKLAPYDWLLLLFGIKKRYSPSLELIAWKNSRSNRYIAYMFRRLRKQIQLGKWIAAENTMWTLMQSKTYQCSAINFVAKGWYKNMKWSEVKSLVRSVSKLVLNKEHKIIFKRVYIEKAGGGIRPLGVPTLPWRVYLHMYNNLLVQWRMETERGQQHAYLPGKGVITAWESLLSRIDSEPNIYEADLTSFFDSVNLEGLNDIMKSELNLPPSEIKFIHLLNQSIVQFSKEGDLQKEYDREVLYHANLEEHKDRELNEDSFKTILDHVNKFAPDLEGLFEAQENLIEEIRSLDIASATVPGFIKVAQKRRETLDYIENEIMLLYFSRVSALREEIASLEIASKTVPGFLKIAEKRRIVLDYFEAQRDSLKLKSPLKGWGMDDIDMNSPFRMKVEHQLSEKVSDQGLHGFTHAPTPTLPSLEFINDNTKKVGVPQGAPTSCSLATLTLRWLEKQFDKRILLYADDFLLFPASPIGDPEINNEDLGIQKKESKSGWVKKDGKWLKDSLTFLGLKYYPSNTMNTLFEDLIERLLPLIALDTLLIGAPLYTVVYSLVVWKQRRKRQARLTAYTRNGSRLEFTNREAFIMYLNNARTILLNSSASDLLNGPNLLVTILDKYQQFVFVKNKTKLFSDKWFREFFGVRRIKESDIGDKFYPHISFTGFMYSRLMLNSWESHIEQNFKLRIAKESWLWRHWSRYARNNNLNLKELNTFNASTFACDALLNYDYKRRKQLIRRVLN